MTGIPEDRLKIVQKAPVRTDGKYVLYWMIAARRTRWNFALDRAFELARELDCPLIVLEPLRVGYRWASDRMHRFVLDGMADNARDFDGTGVLYHPYVEPEAGAGRGLLAELAKDACSVVTDDYPAFFLERMVAAAARQVNVRMEAVDSNGLWPMRRTSRVFARAVDLRRFLQRELPPHLVQLPRREPLRTSLRPRKRLPDGIGDRWPRADRDLLEDRASSLAHLDIDHDVAPVSYAGGSRAAATAMRQFLRQKLERYDDDRNNVDEEVTSGLSPYLHWGHVSAHELFHAIARREEWSPERLSSTVNGARAGWWGMSSSAEAVLDQLVTWRELGFNMCAQRSDYDRYESLPDWARVTLEAHVDDPRPYTYSLAKFEAAATHDDLWNAAQNQLRAEGRIHNYLRMLWGKKILHWSKSPRAALKTLIELNNKYATDGRDPNSYSGIFWTLGRYDRPWGPERPVFGKIRYMASSNTRRKLRVDDYIARWTGLFGGVPSASARAPRSD